MKVQGNGLRLVVGAMLLGCALGPIRVAAQTSSGELRGQVTDPSGAAIANVTVMATPAPGQAGTVKAGQVNRDGTYDIKGLVPGTYSVSALAQGFAPFDAGGVKVNAGAAQNLDIKLQIAEQVQQVNVSGEAEHLSVAPEENASSVIIKGKDLESLSDDPDELQSELEALAGPSAGPSGGQIYIDGFTGGQLPPKDAILEVRINQNPFSAEYDKLGYGRIEITTKPGYSKYHGEGFMDGNASAFNARSPFAVTEPPYNTEFYNANFGGPINKKSAFFFDFFRRDIENSSVVNAVVLSPTFTEQPLNEAIINPQTRMNIGPRFDYQLGKNNVLTARYQYWVDDETNNGIQNFTLPSAGYNSNETEHTLQVSDTQVFSAKLVNQLRFQFLHEYDLNSPLSTALSLNVIGGFNGGGSGAQRSVDTEEHYEIQDLATLNEGKHQFVFGGRFRDNDITNTANTNFNGSFTFPTIAAYQAAEQQLAGCTAPCAGVPGASLFSITTGSPTVNLNVFDVEPYAEDTWRARPNISLSVGLRFESQNIIHDHADFAPRIGLAWGIGGGRSPKTVLRTGFGIFYDRFQQQQIELADRLNGVTERQYIVSEPAFYPNIPSVSELAALNSPSAVPSVYQIGSTVRAPYTIQSALGLERQLSKTTTASVTYINSHGVHQLLTNDINAPLPGTFVSCTLTVTADCGPSTGTRPFPNQGNIYQFESVGLFNENQLVANFNARIGAKLTAFGFYTLSYANSDAGGASSSPMNPYDIREDYGPASFIARHQIFVGGSWSMPKGFRLSPFLMAGTGRPFNITLSDDVYGTSIFNVRPTPVSSGSGTGELATKYGTFYDYGVAGAPVISPYEFFGPGQVSLNARLAKTFGFGKKTARGGGNQGGFGGGGPRGGPGGGLGGRGLGGGGGMGGMFGPGGSENSRYNLEFSVNVRNVFNHINLSTPVGTLGSPLFGESTSVNGFSGYRHLDVAVRFSF